MAIFDDIKLAWGDKEYVIPANRVMGAIATIEETITVSELVMMQGRKVKLSRLAEAYAAVLRYAGAVEVTPDDVYEGMFTGGGAAPIGAAVATLVAIALPPKMFRSSEKDAPQGNG